jgi:hypothetical protein
MSCIFTHAEVRQYMHDWVKACYTLEKEFNNVFLLLLITSSCQVY